MRRLALPTLIAFSLVLATQASSALHSGSFSRGPAGLRAFLLRADEPITHSYSRTPSFTWQPVALQGGHYQFQIATSQAFQDGTLVFKDMSVSQPAETVARQLPWMTGSPYALWAHVRWISKNGLKATPWSTPFGFNVQWAAGGVPAQLPSPEGLVRWTPVDGATAYEVLYPDLKPGLSFQTTTNVADEREFFTFHNQQGYGTIHWRVRAIRDVGQFQSSSNGLPAVSYGPWSPVFTTVNAPQNAGTLKPTDTVSNVWDKGGRAGSAHVLTPGFAWSPSTPVISDGIDPGSSLYRVYVFSDKNCVNRVFTGSVVGSPAWAPRTITDWALPAGEDATGAPVVPNEGGGSQVGANKGSKSTASKTTSAQTSAAPQATQDTQISPDAQGSGGSADLWDSGWPSGRFYWTVVPVTIEGASGSSSSTGTSSSGSSTSTSASSTPSSGTGSQPSGTGTQSSGTGSSSTGSTSSSASAGTSGSGTTSGTATTSGPPSGTYQDTAVPQDSCQAGGVMSFGKVSQPLVTSAGKPFLSGVGASGRGVTAAGTRAVVFASPIAAWQPVVGATKYQVEMSRTLYPWRPAKTVGTPATSVVLPVTKYDTGVWYYHVRGIDQNLPAGARAMAWSSPIQVRVTGNQIAVVK
jgi:hypothetical protein